MEPLVYLDNSSTTRPCSRAIEEINRALTENWGNPSSLHRLGMNAESAVGAARESAAALLRCRSDEIIFTGSGTEANNTALLGAARHGKKRGNRIVTTAIEHPSVLETVSRLESEGFEIIRLHPGHDGVISEKALAEAITPDTILVSMMLVNNETGAIEPVAKAHELIRKAGAPALLHCDAVQAFGKLPFTAAGLGVDLLSASGHKIHASKGIGLLYIRRGVHIPPLLTGGGQERGMRSGTEPVPLICGFGGAIEALPDLSGQLDVQQKLWAFTRDRLLETGFVSVNSADGCLPYILNISVPGYRSETLLHFLESRNIFVSSGSACAKGKGSYVLTECGLDRRRTDSALRISFSRENTAEDAERLVSALTEAVKTIRKA